MWSRLLAGLLYFPDPVLAGTPSSVGLEYEDVWVRAEDGPRLHGWWIPAAKAPARAHVLFFHGNAGNISHRLDHARALAAVGCDVLLFDYRGYGRSAGTPSEEGTYRDARAFAAALRARPGAFGARTLYLGESLGGGVAVALAIEAPPAGLVLQSTFTSVADMARLHYPMIPAAVVPDAYPTLRRVRSLRVPLLVIHGDRDEIVPVAHGRAIHDAALGPKHLEVVLGAGHNDLLWVAGKAWAEAISSWIATVVEE